MIGIELFAGAGGMALGATQAGISTKFAVENDYYATETYAYNHKNTTVVMDNISNIKSIHIDRNKEQLILFGGPPCQGYSNSNQKNRTVKNPLNWLFKEFVRIAFITKPDWIVIENVKGLVSMQNGYFLKKIFNNLNSLGYTINYKVLNAVDFGVPQFRERVFIVASFHGIAFDFPIPMNLINLTVKDAISDLPKLENGNIEDALPYRCFPVYSYANELRGKAKICLNNWVSKNSDLVIERYKFIKQGGNWSSIPRKLMTNYKDPSRCHTGIYKRLEETKPSVVIGNYRKNMLVHPTENRGLSVREAARLQSFPDWFTFKGPLVYQQQQVGNAVPPKLAKVIFDRIIEYK
jgi:DNA (cytosine-5)-methyltransferase 1